METWDRLSDWALASLLRRLERATARKRVDVINRLLQTYCRLCGRPREPGLCCACGRPA